VNALDGTGHAPLHTAVICNNMSVVECLIEYEANIESQTSDDDGLTSLMYVSSLGHLDVVEYLVKQGANIESMNDVGITSLTCASFRGHLEEPNNKYQSNSSNIINILPTELLLCIIQFLCLEAKAMLRLTCKKLLYIIPKQLITVEFKYSCKRCEKGRNFSYKCKDITASKIPICKYCYNILRDPEYEESSICSNCILIKCNTCKLPLSKRELGKHEQCIYKENRKKLERQRVVELRILARRYNIYNRSKFNKAELITALVPYVKEEDFPVY